MVLASVTIILGMGVPGFSDLTIKNAVAYVHTKC